jgi:hypothetical protein
MAHERDDNRYDGQEDGEYHFSDDQGGYEIEPEITPAKVAPTAKSPAAAALPLKERLNQYRKPLIGIGVFILLMFLVYKISAPTSTVPNTDFAQNAGTIPSQKPVMKQIPKPIKTAQQDFQPLPAAPTMSMGSPSASAPAAAMPAPTAETEASNMPQTATTSAPPPPIPETVATSAPPVVVLPPNTTMPADAYYNPAQPNANLSPAEKLAALEQENAKLTAQYAQKLAEQQAQNTALQNQVQDLTQRLASMETTLAHLGHLMQDLKPGHASAMAVGPLDQQSPTQAAAPSGEPK